MSDPKYLYRRAKARVFETVLKPLGYRAGKHIFVRSVDEQLHGIYFQANAKRGGQYFLNLAFSFNVLPPFLQARNALDLPAIEYHMLDFLMWSRVGSFLPGPYVDAWEYDHLPPEGVDALVAKNVADCLDVFERLRRKWANPDTFIRWFPPEVIRRDVALRTEEHEAWNKRLPWSGTFPIIEALGNAWHWQHHNLAYACGIIAGRGGQRELAREYLQLAREVDEFFENMPQGAYAKLASRAGLTRV